MHGFSKSLGYEKCHWDTEHIFSCFILSTSESPSPRVIFSLSQYPWLIRIIANIYWALTCARQWLGICVLLISFSTATLEDKLSTYLIDEQIELESKRQLATVTWLGKGRPVSIQSPVPLHHPCYQFTFVCLPAYTISCVQCWGLGPRELLLYGVGAYSFLQPCHWKSKEKDLLLASAPVLWPLVSFKLIMW